jgi:hypothetical protein
VPIFRRLLRFNLFLHFLFLQHSHPRTNFILISGKSGSIIGRPYLVQTCSDLSTLNVTSELTLQFDCVSEVGRKFVLRFCAFAFLRFAFLRFVFYVLRFQVLD